MTTPPLPLDHFAFRVVDREAKAKALTREGYSVVADFELDLKDGSKAYSYALTHPVKPEVFVSSGPLGSLIWRWVDLRGDQIHHLAFAVDDVASTMKEWQADGVVFDREEPLVCPCEEPLVQVFTKEDPSTGMIYELIERNGHPGFCEENVKRLMEGSAE